MGKVKLSLPLEISLHTLLSCTNYKDIVIVGGLADWHHLDKEIEVNDIDIIFEDFDKIGYLLKYSRYLHVVSETEIYLNKLIGFFDFKGDGELNFDIFQKKSLDEVQSETVQILGRDIQIATKEYMYSFHKFQSEKRKGLKGTSKHSLKYSLYRDRFGSLEEVNLFVDETKNKWIG